MNKKTYTIDELNKNLQDYIEILPSEDGIYSEEDNRGVIAEEEIKNFIDFLKLQEKVKPALEVLTAKLDRYYDDKALLSEYIEAILQAKDAGATTEEVLIITEQYHEVKTTNKGKNK